MHSKTYENSDIRLNSPRWSKGFKGLDLRPELTDDTR